MAGPAIPDILPPADAATLRRPPPFERQDRVSHPLPVDVDIRFRDRRLAGIWDRFKAGERMTLADGVAMLETEDVLALGRMADAYARALHGDRVYFTVNRQLNPTNMCVLDCIFCDYAKSPTDPTATR